MKKARATAVVSDPPRPSVVMSKSVETPWKPATRTIWPRSSASLIRRARTSTIFARPCTVSVTIPACEPVSEIASRPRSWIAIAASAHEIRSPTEISMSSSRGLGRAETRCASATSSSVVCPIAESTATTRLPRSRAPAMRRATARILSGSPTEVPPNFITIVPARAGLAAGATSGTASYSVAVMASIVGRSLSLQLRHGRAVPDGGVADRAAGAALGDHDPRARRHRAAPVGVLAHDDAALQARLRALGRGVDRPRRRGDRRLRPHGVRRLAPGAVASGRGLGGGHASPHGRLVRRPAHDRRREDLARRRSGRAERDPARDPLLLDRLGHGALLGTLAAARRAHAVAKYRIAGGRNRLGLSGFLPGCGGF